MNNNNDNNNTIFSSKGCFVIKILIFLSFSSSPFVSPLFFLGRRAAKLELGALGLVLGLPVRLLALARAVGGHLADGAGLQGARRQQAAVGLAGGRLHDAAAVAVLRGELLLAAGRAFWAVPVGRSSGKQVASFRRLGLGLAAVRAHLADVFVEIGGDFFDPGAVLRVALENGKGSTSVCGSLASMR